MVLKPEDANKLADVHVQAFKGFFLTSLGMGFLRTYYRACLNQSSTIACGLNDEDGNVVGFATGTLESKGYHRKVFISNSFNFLNAIAKSFLTNPKILFRLIRNLEKNEMIEDDQNYAELLSIAVLPDSKGNGLGELLLTSFEDQARNRGALRIALTTDFYNNEGVIKFYEKCGYSFFYSFETYPKRKMVKMIKSL